MKLGVGISLSNLRNSTAVSAPAFSDVAYAGPTPSANWRLPVTDTYDSLGADATFKTAMLASHTAKTRPSPTTVTTPASTTRDQSFKVGTIAAPGAVLSWSNISSTVAVVVTLWESFDSVDGSAASGTWTQNTFAIYGAPEGGQQQGNTNQLAKFAAGAGRWIRLRTVTASGQTGRAAEFFFGQLQADGSHDIWGIIGMSITVSNLPITRAVSIIKGVKPDADPMVITLARSGSAYLSMRNEAIIPFTTYDQFSPVQNILYDFGPNDVLGDTRPWDGDATDLAVSTHFQENLDLLVAKFGAGHVFASNISYFNFIDGQGTQNPPYQNGDPVHPGGSISYNINELNPRIKATAPIGWSAKWEAPFIDDYTGQATIVSFADTRGDGLHGGEPAWSYRRRAIFAKVYGAAAETTMDQVLAQVGVGSIPARMTVAKSLLGALQPTTSPTVSALRASTLATLNAVPSTYTQPSITAPGIAPSAVTSATLIADFDPADWNAVTNNWVGQASNVVDRVNGYVLNAPATTSNDFLALPFRVPQQANGAKAHLDFGQRYELGNGRKSIRSTDAALLALRGTAGVAFTIFIVQQIDLPFNFSGAGGDIMTIDSGSAEGLRISHAADAYAPNLNTNDGTSASFASGDTVVQGQRIAYAFRLDGAGAAKYFRGAYTATGTHRTGAFATAANYGFGHRRSNTALTAKTKLFRNLVYTGAMSDAEVDAVLTGLREAYSEPGKACT